MWVIRNKNLFFILSGVLVALSLGAVFVWGLPLGIDFTGGSIIEVRYADERPATEELSARLDTLFVTDYGLRPTEENGYVLRSRSISEDERQTLINLLSFDGERRLTVERFNSIGPTIGTELRNKALVAIAIVVVAIILFIAFAFRKVSRPVSSWRYGLIAVVALLHDIIIPTGLFVVLGRFGTAEVDVLFVTALLAILGFSVNDTIVVFDRIRENLRKNEEMHAREPFAATVGRSLRETYTRSINTSLTTLAVLVALFIAGGDVTHNFALTLMAGVIVGTYSSIFLASPLLVAFSGERT